MAYIRTYIPGLALPVSYVINVDDRNFNSNWRQLREVLALLTGSLSCHQYFNSSYLICQLIATEHGGGLSLLFDTHVYIFLWLNWLITELFSQRLLSLPACLHAAPYHTQKEMKVMDK